mmetsp:Transcript_95234/g.150604  ORF Transcript_95234/g.150604 Transcript_95234/m.150604 type:complete len:81 (+) Transcript_95234:1472-1714(+)
MVSKLPTLNCWATILMARSQWTWQFEGLTAIFMGAQCTLLCSALISMTTCFCIRWGWSKQVCSGADIAVCVGILTMLIQG